MLARDKDDDPHCERVTEQGLNEDDICRRDAEANVDCVHYTTAMSKAMVGNTYFSTRNCGLDARDVGSNSDHPDF